MFQWILRRKLILLNLFEDAASGGQLEEMKQLVASLRRCRKWRPTCGDAASGWWYSDGCHVNYDALFTLLNGEAVVKFFIFIFVIFLFVYLFTCHGSLGGGWGSWVKNSLE
ncbi:hypothetical protein ACQ4LE_004946 [Meloidogyne hapla]